MPDNQPTEHKQGANLNLVAPSDAFSLNAPYANYQDTYTVLAHGPSEKGELLLYSRADCKDNSCNKVSPDDLAKNILNDPHYHQGQAVTLFACNTGKWGHASYAQVLSDKLGAKVIAPNENIVGLLFVGNNADKGNDYFDGWVIANNIKEVDVSAPPKIMNILGNVIIDSPIYNKVIAEPDGGIKFLNIEGQGDFEVFSPTREIKTDNQSMADSYNRIAANKILELYLSESQNQNRNSTEIAAITQYVNQTISANVNNNSMPEISVNQQIYESNLGKELA